MAAYAAPRKNSSSAMPLTAVITHQQRQRALVGVVEDRATWPSRPLRSPSSAPRARRATKTAARPQPEHDRRDHRPRGAAPRRRSGRGAAGRTRRRRRPTPRPAPGWRGRTSGCPARSAARSRARRRRATTNADRDQLPAAQVARRSAVVARHDVPQCPAHPRLQLAHRARSYEERGSAPAGAERRRAVRPRPEADWA